MRVQVYECTRVVAAQEDSPVMFGLHRQQPSSVLRRPSSIKFSIAGAYKQPPRVLLTQVKAREG